MWKYVTSLFFIVSGLAAVAQTDESQTTSPADSVLYPRTYGLRIGIDLASPARTALEENYTGLQVMADWRLTDKWYVAGELGNESIDDATTNVDYSTDGSYIKLGADYNFYRNWLDMDNMLYAGLRTGVSSFSQELDRFNITQDNNFFLAETQTVNREFSGLTAIWMELQAGVKVELFSNFFMVGNVQLKLLVSDDQPENFDNLYIPGFGRTFDRNSIGVGYTYGIAYRIPIYKK
jgi:hypothetical protein